MPSAMLSLLALVVVLLNVFARPSSSAVTVTVTGNGILVTTIDNATVVAVNNLILQTAVHQSIIADSSVLDIAITPAPMSDLDVYYSLANGTADLGISTTPLSPSQILTEPDLMGYPIGAIPLAPIYNILTSTTSKMPQLKLNSVTLCGIFDGAITWWNDTRIKTLNTGVSSAIPNQQIVVIASTVITNGIASTFVQFCDQVTSSFKVNATQLNWPSPYNTSANHTVGVNQTLPLTFSVHSQIISDPTVNILDLVMRTPYSIAIVSMMQLNSLGPASSLGVANMMDVFNSTVSMSLQSTQLAAQQLAVASYTSNNVPLNLNGATSALAWPINMPVYVIIPRLFSRSTCTMRQHMFHLFQYFITNNGFAAEANNAGILIFDQDIQTAQNLSRRIYHDVTCDMVNLYTTPRNNGFSGTGLVTGAITGLTAQYLTVSPVTTEYQFLSTSSSIALLSSLNVTVNQTVDAVIITQSDSLIFLTDEVVSSFGQNIMIPFTLTATVPTFTFPDAILATADDPSYSSPLYPFVLDADTLADIFTGQITSFLDPRIQSYNPSLLDRFNATNADTNITLVVCCLSSTTSQSITNAFTYQLSQLVPSFSDVAMMSRPMNWSYFYNDSSNNAVRYITTTDEVSAVSIAANTPGSISYSAITSMNVDDTYMIRILSPTQTSQTNSIVAAPAATLSNIAACFPDAFQVGSMTLDLMSPTLSYECWPLIQITAFAVPGNTSSMGVLGPLGVERTDVCFRANQSVYFLQWILTSASATGLINGAGHVRIADVLLNTPMAGYINSLINQIQCDGVLITGTVLYTWSMSGWTTSTFTVLATLMIVVTCVTATYDFTAARAQITTDAAVTLTMASGLLLLPVAELIWLDTPTVQSCHAFVCVLTIASTLMITSAYVHSYCNKLKSTTSSLTPIRRLVSFTLFVFIIDLIILSAWLTSSAAFVPLSRQTVDISGAVTSYNQCSATSSALPYVIPLTLVHGVMLLAVVWNSFDRRPSISRTLFVRNMHIAVYNVIIITSISSAVITMRQSIGDELTIIISVWILEVVFVTYAVIPFSRLYHQFRKAQPETELLNQ